MVLKAFGQDCPSVRFVQIGLGVLAGLLVTGNLIMRKMIDMRI